VNERDDRSRGCLGGHNRSGEHAVHDEYVRPRLFEHVAHVAGDLDACERVQQFRLPFLERD
jgi:hypothetical protein